MGRQLTHFELHERISDKLGEGYEIIDINGAITKGGTATIKCLKHDSTNTVKLNSLVGSKKSAGKSGCKLCKNRKISDVMTTDHHSVKRKLVDYLPLSHIVKEAPNGLMKKAKIYCIESETTYMKTVSSILKSKFYGCPYCAKRRK